VDDHVTLVIQKCFFFCFFFPPGSGFGGVASSLQQQQQQQQDEMKFNSLFPVAGLVTGEPGGGASVGCGLQGGCAARCKN